MVAAHSPDNVYYSLRGAREHSSECHGSLGKQALQDCALHSIPAAVWAVVKVYTRDIKFTPKVHLPPLIRGVGKSIAVRKCAQASVNGEVCSEKILFLVATPDSIWVTGNKQAAHGGGLAQRHIGAARNHLQLGKVEGKR